MKKIILLFLCLSPLWGMAQSEPTMAAPTPTQDAGDVISLFSDAYTDVPVNTYAAPWSAGTVSDVQVDGNAAKLYTNLDFAGIEMLDDNALDLVAAGMTHLHVDVWTPNATTFRVNMVDFGGDGFGGGNDTNFNLPFENFTQGEWVSLDIPLTDFTGMNQTDVSQLVLSAVPAGEATIYLDNLFFYAGVLPPAQMDLPVTFDEDNVLYSTIDFGGTSSMLVEDPENAGNTVVETVKMAGAEIWAGTTLSENLGGTPNDPGFASAIPFSFAESVISVRVWSPAADVPVRLKVENSMDAGIFVETEDTTTVAGAWQTLEFEFKNQVDGTPAIDYAAMYDKLSIFFDFGTSPAADATYYWDDVIFTGTTTVGGTTPMTAAPTPTEDPANVISLFSDAYTDVPVNTFLAVWSNAALEDIEIEGNPTKLYTNLDFAGIEMLDDNALDLVAAGMTHLHVDVWTPNATTFRVNMVDFGGDGFGGGNDTNFNLPFENFTPGQWVSLDIPLTDFMGMNQTDISQLVLSAVPAGASTIYLDNLYFYQGVTPPAQMDLPVTFDEDNVLYSTIDFGGTSSMLVEDPENAGNTVVETVKMAGAEIWAGTTLSENLGGTPNDPGFASAIPFSFAESVISVRVWSPAADVPVRLKVENSMDAGIFVETEDTTAVAGAWQTLEFEFKNQVEGTPAIDYAAMYDKLSIFFDFGTSPAADATYYWDDVIFTGTTTGGTTPMSAAPTPTEDPANVISLFSDAYTNVPVNTFLAVWSAAVQEDIEIEGNPTKLYTNLDFAGIEMLDDNALDLVAAGMTHLHVDVWTPNATTFRVNMVDFGGDGFGGGNDTNFNLPFENFTLGEWVSLDIPLTDFMGMNQTDISQLVLSAVPAGQSTVYLDNLYFYKEAVQTGDQMDLPVTFDDPEVLYSTIDFGGTASTIVEDPEAAGNMVVETVKTAGAETWAGTTLSEDLGGTPNDPGFASAIPFTDEATIISVRVWSPAADIPVRLKVENSMDAAVSVETETMTTEAGAWQTLEFEFKNNVGGTSALDYEAVYNKLSIFFDFDTSPAEDVTYYWDDIIFTGTTTTGEDPTPMEPAPTPTVDPAFVISMFSDAYADVPVDTWLTTWSAANLEDIEIEGNPTKLYTALDFAGIETVGPNAIDLVSTEMTHLHVDFWSPNSTTFRIKLVDFGGDGFGGGNDTEFEIPFELAQEEWVSLDIPLVDFEGMNQDDISQFIISSLPAGGSTVYLDNVYYYDADPSSTNAPELGVAKAFPNPGHDNFTITAPAIMDEVILYNASGQVVKTWQPLSTQLNVDASNLNPGVYVAMVQSGSRLMVVRLIKQ
ncbi:T9SS type A sorting domain-containing protein [Phaeodactylibacter xiamenensis]|uniref:T9SS type A sorting domain-containing protein n=1 Tax=Phaeodactylibacter xiamenensis TaxID=1524460 RepID=UPI003BA95CAF